MRHHLVPSIPGSNNPTAMVPPSTTITRGPPPPKLPKVEDAAMDSLIDDCPPIPAPIVTMSTGDLETTNDSAGEETGNGKHKYVCRLCKTEFDKQKAVVEHLALAHFYQVWEDDRPENSSFFVPPEGPYVCPHCPYTSAARASFIAHFVNQHEALKSVMSLQYGEKTVEDLYVVTGASNEDETYDEGDDEEDDIDDDEENAREELDIDDMDDEMDGQTSDLEFNENSTKMTEEDSMAAAEASGAW